MEFQPKLGAQVSVQMDEGGVVRNTGNHTVVGRVVGVDDRPESCDVCLGFKKHDLDRMFELGIKSIRDACEPEHLSPYLINDPHIKYLGGLNDYIAVVWVNHEDVSIYSTHDDLP